jgi:hypothetical protein
MNNNTNITALCPTAVGEGAADIAISSILAFLVFGSYLPQVCTAPKKKENKI